jgi:hypothetical protein
VPDAIQPHYLLVLTPLRYRIDENCGVPVMIRIESDDHSMVVLPPTVEHRIPYPKVAVS